MNYMPATLRGMWKDTQSLYRFGCAKALPESARVFLGGQTEAQQRAASNRAWLYSGMAKIAVAVGVVALAVLLSGAAAAGAGVLVSNGMGGALLATYGQGVTAQQLITYGTSAALGAFAFKLGAWIAEKIWLGMQERTVQDVVNRNWGWTPASMQPYVSNR